MTPAPASASIPISLRRLFPDASFVGCGEIVVTDATERSGDCRPGCLFAALPGTKVHGRTFVTEAVGRGAIAVLSDRPLADLHVPQCIVREPRAAYSRLCHTICQWPSRRLGMVGVTGTNGKTSVTWLVRRLLQQAGLQTGLLGTIEYHDGEQSAEATLTTPDARSLAGWLASARSRRTTHMALELSSHALAQDRACGLELDVAIVTNITHDHFDFHRNFEAYRDAKARIARLLKRGGRLVLNADDPGSRSLLGEAPASAQALTFGLDGDADVRAREIAELPGGCRFRVDAGAASAQFETSLIGRHNVANCLAAVGAGLHFGLSLAQIADGIRSLSCIPGRMQRIDAGQPFQVFIDYAHTPDALERAITAVRRITPGRVICLFGAGGERDRSKRPVMGAAGTLADIVVVTSDNPRGEDPQSILYDILSGCVASQVHVDPDREQAIAWALRTAQPGDSVLVAGKGHESVQIIGSERIPFDDAAVCRQYLPSAAPLPHLTLSRPVRQTA